MDKLTLTYDYLKAMGYNMDNITFGDFAKFNQELQEHIKESLPDFLPGDQLAQKTK